jgi:hypothetical protein
MTITAKTIRERSLIFSMVWFNPKNTPSKMPLKATKKSFRGDSS